MTTTTEQIKAVYAAIDSAVSQLGWTEETDKAMAALAESLRESAPAPLTIAYDDSQAIADIWDAAKEEAAMYVENHCVDGEMHANAILNAKRPPIRKLAAPAPQELTAVRLLERALPYIKYRRDDSPAFVVAHDDMLKEIRAFLESRSNAPQPEAVAIDDLKQQNQRWNSGNEFLPFHPSASHVSPAYRDGWNDCYAAAMKAIATRENNQ